MADRGVTEMGRMERGDVPLGADGLWIFGYGSLVWRPAFPHVERRPARVRGWKRRFWQGSTDHRGVPGAPGRVVTVLPDPDAVCWGVAFRVAPAAVAAVLANLDVREQGGYERHRVRLGLADGAAGPEALMYVATPANPNYLGPAPIAAIVDTIRDAHGPSGANREYAIRLAEALRAMGADDPHVFAVADALADETAVSSPRAARGRAG